MDFWLGILGGIILMIVVFTNSRPETYGTKEHKCKDGYHYILFENKDETRVWFNTNRKCEE